MLIANQRASRSIYPAQLKAVMCVEKAEDSRKRLSRREGINRGAAPLPHLPDLAERFGVAQVLIKDEAIRSAW